MTDFTTIERVAREICDHVRGAGTWERKRTKRALWREKARRLIEHAHRSPTATALYRACGWPV